MDPITTAITSAKAAIDIIKGFNALKTEAEINDIKIDLTNIIVSLQQSLLSQNALNQELVNNYDAVTKEKVELDKYISDLGTYNLTEIAPRVFVYINKDNGDITENSPWYCANCFDNSKKKTIYQNKHFGNTREHLFYCPQCKNEIKFDNKNYKMHDGIFTSSSRRIDRI